MQHRAPIIRLFILGFKTMKTNIANSILLIIYSATLGMLWANALFNAMAFIAAFAVAVMIIMFVLFRKQAQQVSFNSFFLIATFMLIINVPFLAKKETSSFEKRPLTPVPVFNINFIWGYFFDYQKYFEDRFAFRNTLIKYYSKTKLLLFSTSPMPNLVAIGKQNWLFYVKESLVKDANTPFTEAELKQIRLNLQLTTLWLKQKNINYYYLLVPYKQRIYPEYTTPLINHSFSFSKINQLYDFLYGDSIINLIDVRQELIEGKSILPTYIKTDTHWTEWGAFLAYQKTMAHLTKDYNNIVADKITHFNIDTTVTDAGDLQLMLGLKDDITYTYHRFTHKSGIMPTVVDSSLLPNASSTISIREMHNDTLMLKLFLVRDSFSEYLRIFLTPHFKRTVLSWTNTVPINRVLAEQPNIVLHEMLEQYIDNLLILPDTILSDSNFVLENKKLFCNKNYAQ